MMEHSVEARYPNGLLVGHSIRPAQSAPVGTPTDSTGSTVPHGLRFGENGDDNDVVVHMTRSSIGTSLHHDVLKACCTHRCYSLLS